MHFNIRHISLIPLLIMFVSATICISSGFGYTSVPGLFYTEMMIFSFGLFYLVKMVLGWFIKKYLNLVTLIVVTLFLIPEFFYLKELILEGMDLFSNILRHNLFVSYGINLGKYQVVASDGIAASFFIVFIIQIVVYFTLAIFEKEKREVFVLLLPVLTYFFPIACDTVPNEFYVISFVVALLVFLCVEYNNSVNTMVISTVFISLFALLIWHYAPWNTIYQTMINVSDSLNDVVGKNKPVTGKTETLDKKETINYGAFDRDGRISYTGDVLLKLYTEKKYEKSGLYLVGRYCPGMDEYPDKSKKNIDGGTYYGSLASYSWGDFAYGDIYSNPKNATVTMEKDIEIRTVVDFDNLYIPISPNKDVLKNALKLKLNDVTDMVSERASGVFGGIENDANNKTGGSRGPSIFLPMDEESNKYFTNMSEDTSKLCDAIQTEIIDPMMAPENKIKTLGDVVSYLKNYFDKNYSYTLTPGEPLNTANEEINRFLFGTKQGYCTHYAYASTLLFRKLGIGSRMVLGYALDGVRLNIRAETNVLDSDAHAWTEIYVPDYGWLTLDFTPYGDRIGIYSKTDETDENQNVNEADDNYKKLEATEPPQQEKKGFNIDFSLIIKYAKFIFIIVLILAVIIIIVFFVVSWITKTINYLRLKKKYKHAGYNEKLVLLQGRMEVMYEVIGTKWSFSSKQSMTDNLTLALENMLGDSFTEDEREQVGRYIHAVYEAAFNNNSMDREKLNEIINGIMKLYNKCKKHLGFRDKMRVRQSGVFDFMKTYR